MCIDPERDGERLEPVAIGFAFMRQQIGMRGPRDTIEEVGVILDSAEMRKRFELEGAEAIRMPPAEMTSFVAKETEKWTRVVKEAGIKPE